MLVKVLRRIWASNHSSAPGADVPLPTRSDPPADRVPNFFSPVFWGTTDQAQVVEAARRIVGLASPGHHFGDNFLTWGRNLSMLDDERFVQAWRENIEGPSDEAIVWRRYILATSAFHAVQLGGDFVECGAYTGVGMKTVIDYLGGPSFPRQFWGYDAFEHTPDMLNHPMPELGPGLFDRVQAKFSAYPQVHLRKGLIPEVFTQGAPEQIAFLHVDLNQAPAEIAALEHLFERMVPGGIVVLDDYEWAGIYRPQKLSEDPWFDARGYRVMPLPTGQGLVIKR